MDGVYAGLPGVFFFPLRIGIFRLFRAFPVDRRIRMAYTLYEAVLQESPGELHPGTIIQATGLRFMDVVHAGLPSVFFLYGFRQQFGNCVFSPLYAGHAVAVNLNFVLPSCTADCHRTDRCSPVLSGCSGMMLPLCSPHFLPIRPLPGLLHQPLALLHRPLFLRHARVRVLQRKFMWALRFSLLYAILRMNPDLVPANGTLEFPKPWNQSAVLFCFLTSID